MTTVVPLKKGDRLVPNPSSTWGLSWVEAEVMAVEFVGGIEQAWIKLTPKSGGSSTLNTISVDTLRRTWQRKPTFYKIGGSYVWQRVYVNPETFKILDVFQVQNPATPGDKFSAFAICTDSYGKQYGTSLNASDFSRMKPA